MIESLWDSSAKLKCVLWWEIKWYRLIFLSVIWNNGIEIIWKRWKIQILIILLAFRWKLKKHSNTIHIHIRLYRWQWRIIRHQWSDEWFYIAIWIIYIELYKIQWIYVTCLRHKPHWYTLLVCCRIICDFVCGVEKECLGFDGEEVEVLSGEEGIEILEDFIVLIEMWGKDLLVYLVDGVEGAELIVFLADVVGGLQEGNALREEHERGEDEDY